MGPLNLSSECIMERNPLHVIIVGMDFSAVGDLKNISKCKIARDLRCLSHLRKQILAVGPLNTSVNAYWKGFSYDWWLL